jgi:hypothetical protein
MTLGPLLFLLYVNDLPNDIGNKAKPILFADDTSILITASDTAKLQNDVNIVFEQINKWFEANFCP